MVKSVIFHGPQQIFRKCMCDKVIDFERNIFENAQLLPKFSKINPSKISHYTAYSLVTKVLHA